MAIEQTKKSYIVRIIIIVGSVLCVTGQGIYIGVT